MLNIAQVSLSTSGWCVCLSIIKSYCNISPPPLLMHISPVYCSSCWLKQITRLQISYQRRRKKKTKDRIIRLDIRKTFGNEIVAFMPEKEKQGRIIWGKVRGGGRDKWEWFLFTRTFELCLMARHEWVDFNSIDCCFGHQQTHADTHTTTHAQAQTVQAVWNTEWTCRQVGSCFLC